MDYQIARLTGTIKNLRKVRLSTVDRGLSKARRLFNIAVDEGWLRVAAEVKLSNEQREQLEKQARARSVSVRLAQRSKMMLMAAEGIPDVKVAAELGVARQTVARWRSRFNVQGEKDAPRPGAQATDIR